MPRIKKREDDHFLAVKVDAKYRIPIPVSVREGFNAGDTILVRRKGGILMFAKPTDPFAEAIDALADDAKNQRKSSRSRTLKEYAEEHGIEVD